MHFLLAADDRDVGSCLRRKIEGAGHILDWTADGHQAFECASSSRYDAVIVDLSLSDMRGIELCGRLRQVSQALPILVLSASGLVSDRLDSFSAGADDVLASPFDFDELMARLVAIQRRKMPACVVPAARPTRLIVIDQTNDATRRMSRIVGLTDRERQFFDALLGYATTGASSAAALRKARRHDLDVRDQRTEASGKRLGLHERLALVRDIGREFVRSGARLGRRRA